ncbi:MAG: carbon-nitrogen hydrolase family protein [Candidatus Lindowbacteria bacterium]|nr:carbon-nitrogen hydrolase family protein [Candidatus Lindowbacteria bacterium]
MRASVIQFNAGDNEEQNLERLDPLIRKAAENSDLIVLPEVAYFRGKLGVSPRDTVPGNATRFISVIAKETSTWIHGGTIFEKVEGSDKAYNTSFLCNPNGELAGTYRKIHLFDVDLPNVKIFESKHTQPGSEMVTTKIKNFTAGFLTCYDLRFPGIWAGLRTKGVDLFFLPSNFTQKTGEAHWETLIRARAIETQSYVLASSQFGVHPGIDVDTYGCAMIVDPWGTVLAKTSSGTNEFATAEISLDSINDIRANMPVFEHQRKDIYS